MKNKTRFIMLHTKNGVLQWTNPTSIIAMTVVQSDDGRKLTRLTFNTRDVCQVVETPSEIIEKIRIMEGI